MPMDRQFERANNNVFIITIQENVMNTRLNRHLQDLKLSMKSSSKKSWMAEHLRERHIEYLTVII